MYPLKSKSVIRYSYINYNNQKNLFFLTMPQLVPFYFINEVTFAFAILVTLIYIFSKYVLPRFVRLFTTRLFISKL